ncbi:sugar-binding transcriptional regulator [Microbacterium sp. KUDC0406]|uniref:sugar-binding transcriptional regulator n=1 Tax=Microbacterium sp. KUDC0406 TaxID=2909588 RepID=UPI001F3BB917|nr:sugar-binding domain-containing protein [Microbacterium sp. KUDC0406]UJP09603.1 sugar-binding transcriptional regulator [Microbacterium sp. KUDC0406]
MDPDELAVMAAQQYYDEGRTMAAIAHDLQVSRSSVSRLLAGARENGLVEIRVLPPRFRIDSLERAIAARHNVRARVVAVPDGTPGDQRYARTANAAAALVVETMNADAVLALSWGTMVNEISRHLTSKPCTNSWIVQANGIGQSSSGIHHSVGILERFSSAFGASIQQVPFPIFLDSPESKQLIERERLMRNARSMLASADLFLFNVGTVNKGHPNQPWLNGHFLDEDEFGALREDGAIGDVATTFVDAEGRTDRIRMNDRTTGPDPTAVLGIPRRICVTCGNHKVPALTAALRGGFVTDLVIDEVTATTLLG